MSYRTNRQWRTLVALADLPAKTRADFAYYIAAEEEHTPRFVKYRGTWYDVLDTLQVSEELASDYPGWHSYHADSFYSGILFKLSRDGERVQVATFIV